MSEQLLPHDIKLDLSLPPIVEMKYPDGDTPITLICGYLGLKHTSDTDIPEPMKRVSRTEVTSLIAQAYLESEERRRVNPGRRLPYIGQKKFIGNDVNPRKISNYLGLSHVDDLDGAMERQRSINYTNVLALILGLAMLYHQLAHPQVTVDSSQIPSQDIEGFEPGEMIYKTLGFNRQFMTKDVFEETFSHTHPISSTISYSNGD